MYFAGISLTELSEYVYGTPYEKLHKDPAGYTNMNKYLINSQEYEVFSEFWRTFDTGNYMDVILKQLDLPDFYRARMYGKKHTFYDISHLYKNCVNLYQITHDNSAIDSLISMNANIENITPFSFTRYMFNFVIPSFAESAKILNEMGIPASIIKNAYTCNMPRDKFKQILCDNFLKDIIERFSAFFDKILFYIRLRTPMQEEDIDMSPWLRELTVNFADRVTTLTNSIYIDSWNRINKGAVNHTVISSLLKIQKGEELTINDLLRHIDFLYAPATFIGTLVLTIWECIYYNADTRSFVENLSPHRNRIPYFEAQAISDVKILLDRLEKFIA